MTNEPFGDAADLDAPGELAAADDAFIRGLLADLPTPPMPADLVARIDAALAAEPPLAITGAATIVPLASRRAESARSQRNPRILQIAAALILVVAGGVFAVKSLGSGDSASLSTAGSAAGKSADPSAERSLVVTASGRAYTKDSLTSAIRAQAVQPSALSATDGTTANYSAKLAADPQLLAKCIEQVQGGPATALPAVSVDLGTFEGKPAAVIALQTATPGTLSVFVVKPDCGTTAEPTILYFASVRGP